MKIDFSDIDGFFEQGEQEVYADEKVAGEQAVEYNRINGTYHDVTGNLRASNYYEVSERGLVIGNHAAYASEVEARGGNVASEGALYAHILLNED